MANSNRPMGLAPVAYLNGSPWNGQARCYSIAAAYDTALYIGDPVKSSGTADANGLAGIVLGSTTGALRGVIVGLSDQPYGEAIVGNPNITYRPAAATAKDWYAMVADDPNIVFEVQEIGTGTPLTAAAVGLNADLESGTGNGYVSGWMLGNDNENTTSTLQVKLLGLVQRFGNAFGQYAKWLVKINNHEFSAGTDGV